MPPLALKLIPRDEEVSPMKTQKQCLSHSDLETIKNTDDYNNYIVNSSPNKDFSMLD